MKKYLTLFAAAMLTAACSNDSEAPDDNQSKGTPIAVTVDEGSFTRATGEITTDSKLAEKSFGLFGLYTGKLTYENTSVSSDFMYNQKVIGSLNANGKYDWDYNPIKYWPNTQSPETGAYNEYISFFAYAPYEATPKEDGRCIFGMSDKYDKGDPWVNYRLSEDPWGDVNPQVDLMYGVMARKVGYDELFMNQSKPAFNDKMKFLFLHALECIGDLVTIQQSDSLYNYINGYADVIITDVRIVYKNLTTKARLVLNSPSGPNWKEIISGELTTERTLSIPSIYRAISNKPDTISVGKGLFYIPMQIAGMEAPCAEVSVDYTISNNNGTTYNGTTSATFKLDMSMEGYKQGIALILGRDLDLLHLTYPITNEEATEPSYSREWK